MADWLLSAVGRTWTKFEDEFKLEWDQAKINNRLGNQNLAEISSDDTGGALHTKMQDEYLRGVWEDALGYAGLEMIRYESNLKRRLKDNEKLSRVMINVSTILPS